MRLQTGPALFDAANYETLLLHEIGEISSGMLVNLLRVLQGRQTRQAFPKPVFDALPKAQKLRHDPHPAHVGAIEKC